jgi:hypothetical protein
MLRRTRIFFKGKGLKLPDSDELSGEHEVERVEAEAALTAKEIGDVRRFKAGLPCEQYTAEGSTLDTAQEFLAELLM